MSGYRQGDSGLILNEPLLWEKGKKGRSGFSLPTCDVDEAVFDENFSGEGPDFPDLSEVEVVRHYTRLSTWNFGVDTGLYPLGSCTMKYNPKTNERQAGLPGFAGSHPMLPEVRAQGALKLMYDLEQFLAEITGMAAATLQPAAGAHGELTGILMIHAYHLKNGEKRTKMLVPDTAHGTNPASGALCGYAPVAVPVGDDGVMRVEDVRSLMDGETAGIMITNPNTLGLFETHIKEICEAVHEKGGLVYGDGANLNAIMGHVKMAELGVDVMHFNLHKTFSTPHGGGGPGSGPVAVNKTLEPFLPVPRVAKEHENYTLVTDRPDSIGRMMTFYGHFGVMIRAYSYILTMGGEGLKTASSHAVLNANYIKERLKEAYHLAFDRICMHECVFSDEKQHASGVTTLDVAKSLIDYGFHPPTVYFPLVVSGAIMIEPTETETKEDLDNFIETLMAISEEAKASPELLKAAPTRSKVRRLDETSAARKPCLCG